MRGGYIILDLKSKALTSGTAAKIDGAYAAASSPYKKAVLVSNLVVGNTEYADFYADFSVASETASAAVTIGGDTITIEVAANDNVTVTVA